MLYCCVYCLYIFTVQITTYDASFYKSITSCISVTSYFYKKKLRSQSHKSQLKFSVWNYVFLQHSSICVTFNKKSMYYKSFSPIACILLWPKLFPTGYHSCDKEPVSLSILFYVTCQHGWESSWMRLQKTSMYIS